jgi:uncharacterized protein YndB with AHSA1/START domain
VGEQDLGVVAAQPLHDLGPWPGGDLRAPPGRPHLRAHPEGAEHDWGEILAWEPPHRLAYLWHLGTDRTRATEVDISFTGGASATTVTITHRGWERLGADAPAWRQRNLGGWSGLLPHFRQAAAAAADSGAPESGG